ncbi:putative OST3/OST6 family protein [Seiridium unicorne]|uniref:OST3/OST6 family protein n=1 Tax=Seiridium unicorne TaxID=138068 RepID=A0ABR2UW77_9PEZI
MRWLSLLLSAALPFGALAAKKSASVDRFDEFHTKATSSYAPAKLDDKSYKKLTSAPRDFTAAVLLTAMDSRFGCQLCREFQPEWDVLAKSWTKGDKKGESRLVFGTLDFADGRDTFVSLGLQTAPVLLLFQPTTGPHAVAAVEPLRYDFTNGPQVAEQVHSWVARHMADRPQPPVKRPINYVLWAVSIITALATVGIGFKAWPYILPVLQNRNVWATITIIMILACTGGHMFNQIRKVPYVSGDGRGNINYFTGGFQNQLGIETQIVGFIYGALSFMVIALILRAPRQADSKLQQAFVIAMSGGIFIIYGLLMSIFRIKNGGYPFGLPPFA